MISPSVSSFSTVGPHTAEIAPQLSGRAFTVFASSSSLVSSTSFEVPGLVVM